MRTIGLFLCLICTGCITRPPPAVITQAPAPVPTPAVTSPPTPIKGLQERLFQAIEEEDEHYEACRNRLDQNQIRSAIEFVRCWAEPTRLAYQQSDLLIMDLVEQRLDVMYQAAAMLDNDELTADQWLKVRDKVNIQFLEEIRKRFQWSAPPPRPSPPAATTRDK
jgi:tRNA A37 N6-isopentenylltransferase MiaA